jgi:hypothetical protein
LIAALTIEAMVLRGLRRAVQAEEARSWLVGMQVTRVLAPASLALILLMGMYLMAIAWGPKGWILAALAGLVVIGVLGGALTGTRMARIGPAVGRASGLLPDQLLHMLRDPILLVSARIRTALVLGIAFLMTVKPALVASLVIVVFAGAIGLVAARIPVKEESK